MIEKKRKKNHLMKGANRNSLNASFLFRAINIKRNIRQHNPMRDIKISCMFIINMNQPRPSSSFAIQKPYIRCNIKTTTQSLNGVAESSRQSIRTQAHLFFHKREIFVLACLLGWFLYFLPFSFFLVFCRAVG